MNASTLNLGSNRAVIALAIVQLAIYLTWLFSETLLANNTPVTSLVVSLVMSHSMFSAIALGFAGHESRLRISVSMLLLPLPVYTLLFLMGGLELEGMLAAHLVVAATLAIGMLLTRIGNAIGQLAPVMLVWFLRGEWIAWVL